MPTRSSIYPPCWRRASESGLALTFDDGLGSFYENGWPLLRSRSIPATVFVIGTAVREPPGLRFMRCERLMTTERLREIAADPLIMIGAHTMSHLPLSRLDVEGELREEINGGTERAEAALGVLIDRFCCPYYNWSEEAHEIVRERHALAVRGRGSNTLIEEGTNSYHVPRTNGATSFSDLRYAVSDTRKAARRNLVAREVIVRGQAVPCIRSASCTGSAFQSANSQC
jgi:peptidoglycan/xylan/chitin deacetylase (PgdA/CDA1 family)